MIYSWSHIAAVAKLSGFSTSKKTNCKYALVQLKSETYYNGNISEWNFSDLFKTNHFVMRLSLCSSFFLLLLLFQFHIIFCQNHSRIVFWYCYDSNECVARWRIKKMDFESMNRNCESDLRIFSNMNVLNLCRKEDYFRKARIKQVVTSAIYRIYVQKYFLFYEFIDSIWIRCDFHFFYCSNFNGSSFVVKYDNDK